MIVNLKEKNALVCGASQGMGKAVAMQLAASGANVTLLARNRDLLESVLEQLQNDGTQKHDYICSDIRDFQFISSQLQERISRGKNYHILINNTGGPKPGALIEAEVEDLKEAFEQHVIAAQRLTKFLLPQMKTEKFGRIINIISVGLKQPIANLGVSNTIRGAMGSWGKTLSNELAPYGITVNNILPGYTNTERLQNLINTIAENKKISRDKVVEDIESEIPAGRLGKPEEISYIVTFLCSDLAGYINGINLPVDGGYLRTL